MTECIETNEVIIEAKQVVNETNEVINTLNKSAARLIPKEMILPFIMLYIYLVRVISFVSVLVLFLVTVGCSAKEPIKANVAASRPNVILVITDDQGYGDISALGNPVINTPNIDELYNESVRFTNFHVDPTCSPSRGALLTGKYAHRARVWHTIAGGNHLRASEVTIADVFKHSGYNTAMFGKWHLGGNYPYRPMDRGFDEWLGHGDGGTGTTDDYFTNDRVNDHYLHNGEFEYRQGYAPDVFFNAAADFAKQRKKQNNPFFIYLSTYIPHSPHTIADQEWVARFKNKIITDEAGIIRKVTELEAYFYAGIERVDHNLGLLRQKLEQQGLSDNTIFIFMTDNGGTNGVKLFNAAMRGHKGQVYEGGHRVPFFIHWPDGYINKSKLKHGSDVKDLTAHFDVLPTLIDLLNLSVPTTLDLDGRSFASQLTQPNTLLPSRTLFVEKQRSYQAHAWQTTAAMTNKWRLVNEGEGDQLYDIQQDPSQQHNLINQYPKVVAKFKADFKTYWARVSPDDRSQPHSVLGHANDPEILLHAADWYLPSVPWNHAQTAKGSPESGAWLIQVAQQGQYQFELRRWPKEANTLITSIPTFTKKVDAWDSYGGKDSLLYDRSDVQFKALGVKYMRLILEAEKREGANSEDNSSEITTSKTITKTKRVSTDDTHINFDVNLSQKNYRVTAQMLDENKEVIAGAYYVYARKSPKK